MSNTLGEPGLTRIKILSYFFLISGFCALLYQLVYLRLAFSAFGVITPVVSVVLSIFMLGLGIGGWLGGRWIDGFRLKTRVSAIVWYGATEIFIGLGAFAVPAVFSYGRHCLLAAGQSSSFQYLAWSGLILSMSLLPWTLAMGATLVLGMAFLREYPSTEHRTFGILYVANVVGAVLGTAVTAFLLIELLGFRHTLYLAAALNFLIGLSAICWGLMRRTEFAETSMQMAPAVILKPKAGLEFYGILFLTGFATMAMEVVWTRAFAKVLGPFVYSFASLLTVYLISTACGSLLYRDDVSKDRIKNKEQLLAWCAIFAFLPVVLADPRWPIMPEIAALFSIAPISAVIGYMTPMLVDELSQGDEARAGKAYAINVAGCVLGPLVSGYLLLPTIGAQQSLILLAVPFLLISLLRLTHSRSKSNIAFSCCSALLLVLSFYCRSWEDASWMPQSLTGKREPVVCRDYVATTIACGDGLKKNLLVNGTAMTRQEPSVKMMAHLPLAFHRTPPKSALVICFGMGTTFRSALTWGIPVTAVDLVPGVPRAFSYFWTDAPEVMKNPHAQVVIDDGRRFLARTDQKFDIVTIDPPQPLAAAGSSLLYSKEFYQEVKQHLNPGGIVQEYMPGTDYVVLSAVARSLGQSFPHVRVYILLGGWGYHILASDEPFVELNADQLLAKMPPKAIADFEEFVPSKDKLAGLKRDVETVLGQEISLSDTLAKTPDVLTLSDDRPLNEYCLLRSTNGHLRSDGGALSTLGRWWFLKDVVL